MKKITKKFLTEKRWLTKKPVYVDLGKGNRFHATKAVLVVEWKDILKAFRIEHKTGLLQVARNNLKK